MNPNYNRQSYSYQHSTAAGPPQAQTPWQPDSERRSGWGDPRLQNTLQSPPPSTNFAFVPNGHVQQTDQPQNVPPPPPRPPPSAYDTSQWGVNYQSRLQDHNFVPVGQTFVETQRPALPARPNNTTANDVQPSNQSLSNAWQSAGYAPQQSPTNAWTQSSMQQQFDQAPIPPPRPPAYSMGGALPNSNASYVEYSHQPPTHRYDPPNASVGWSMPHMHQQNTIPPDMRFPTQSASTWNYGPPVSDGTVSPMEEEGRKFSVAGRSQTVSPVPSQALNHSHVHSGSQYVSQYPDVHVSATALGPGKPSDWQHYHATDPYEDDTINEAEQTPTAGSNPLPLTSSPLKIEGSLSTSTTESNASRPERSFAAVSSTAGVALENPPSRPEISGPSTVLATTRVDKQSLPQRTASSSTTSSRSSLQRSGTIDSVIKAWSTPLRGDTGLDRKTLIHRPTTSIHIDRSTSPNSIDTINRQTQTDFAPIVKTEVKIETITEVKEKEVDPYADLHDHYAATLRRFAVMLRQEAEASHDDEKFKMFQGFVIRELRLRSVLYGVEAYTFNTKNEASKLSEALDSTDRTVLTGTPTPAPEPVMTEAEAKRASSVKPNSGEQSQGRYSRPKTPPADENPEHTPHTPSNRPTVRIAPPMTPPIVKKASASFDTMDNEGEYSPGGRPLMQNVTQPSADDQVIPLARSTSASDRGAYRADSPGANAPMTLEDYQMPDKLSSSSNAPIVFQDTAHSPGSSPPLSMSANLTGPVNFSPPRPVYTPFRYNEVLTDTSPASKPQASSESYATIRQVQAIESGRLLVTDAPPVSPTNIQDRGHTKTPSLGRREHEEAFIGLIRQQSKVLRKRPSGLPANPLPLRIGTPAARNTPAPVVPPLEKAMQGVRAVLPPEQSVVVNKECCPELDSIQRSCTAVRDDFGFIHATVLSWDLANRKIRQQLDAERHTRQSENEARVDQLFNDNEIGYADIADLESGSKLDEASRKYQEDKLELESFDRDVFEIVVSRIENELTELIKLQTAARDVLDLESTSVSQRGRSEALPKAPVAEVMDIMLQLFRKAEVRHIKVAEAHFERERRRKMLELSVLYTNGDKAGVKRLEQEYAKAQAIQVFEEARRKTERMNSIMDSLDRAVVKGLAENQAWIDEVLPKLQLLRDLVMGPRENGPKREGEREQLLYGDDGVRDLMVRTQTMIDLIIADSQRIVRAAYEAEQLLNEADFGAYLAKEKLAESDLGKLQKLEADKMTEDTKVREEFEARLRGVCRDPEEATVLVREVNAQVGTDKEHKSRINRALDAAKKRNTIGAKPPP